MDFPTCSNRMMKRSVLKRAHAFLIATCAITLALGCGEEPPTKPSAGRVVDSKLTLVPSETFAPARTFTLRVATERQYECSNFQIDATYTRVGNRIWLTFGAVELKGSLCATAVGPATCLIDFGSLPNGTYELVFTSPTGATKATLTVTSDAFTFSSIDGANVDLLPTLLRRIPADTIWGLIGYHGLASQPYDSLGQAFLDSLTLAGASPSTLLQGDYGAFQVDASGKPSLPGEHGYYRDVAFVRKYTGSAAALARVSNWVGAEESSWLSTQILTPTGAAYRSWLQSAHQYRPRSSDG